MLNKNLYKKHEEIINYLIVGIITTIVSLLLKWVLLFLVFNPNNAFELQCAVIISWIIAVTLAYILNRIIVFKSDNNKIIKEILCFFSARIITLLLEMFIMWLFVTILKLNTNEWVLIFTVICQILVTVSNYIFSKVFVFKSKP